MEEKDIEKLAKDTAEGIEKKLDSKLEEKTKDFAKIDKVTELENKNAELEKALENQGMEINKLKENPISGKKTDKFGTDLKNWLEGEDMKKYISTNAKGNSPELRLKYTLTGGERTGTVLITEQHRMAVDEFFARPLHVRDLMSVLPTDMPNHTWDKVTSWTPGIDMVSENGDAPTFNIATAEQTASVKRVAGIMDISRNALRSTDYIIRHIQNRAPEKLKNIEDFQILFGDGAGNNLNGIYGQATNFDLDGASFAATAIASVASYDGGAKTAVTFTNAHNLTNAYKITFANATEPTYNAQFQVNVKSEKVIIIDVAYVVEADTSAWTATTVHNLKGSVDSANDYDVLVAMAAFMATTEYKLNGFIMNPERAAIIEMLKDTTGQPLSNIERINGTLFVRGIPVIETNAMPADRVLGGDWQMAAELLEYEGMSLQFVEDVSYVKANKVALYITEQVILPVYNPFLFVKADFTAAKADLETP